MQTCIRQQHCEVVANAAEIINRIRQFCQLQDQGFHPATIVARIRDIVEPERFKRAGS